MDTHPIDVACEMHGPFERISLTRRDPLFPRPPQLSVYRVGDTLIDTGGTLTARALVRAVADRPPTRILCTHQHEDHVGGVTALREAYGAIPVFVPRPHLPLLVGFDRVPQYRGLYWGHPLPIDDAIVCDVGDVFHVGKLALETIASPGHTPGHISFVARDGDRAHVLTGDLYTTSPLVAWHESSAPCPLRSCRSIAALADEVTMLPTHGRVRSDGRVALLSLVREVEPACERVLATAATMGFAGPLSHAQLWAVADEALGPDDGRAVITEGEWSHACFVRSVLTPVLELPVSGIRTLPPNGGA